MQSSVRKMKGMQTHVRISGLLAGLVLATSTAGAQTATLALIGGHVVTVDSTKPEAEAIAIAGDRILAVGTSDEIRKLVGPSTRVIDLKGRLAIPGLIEGHGHFMGLGESKQQIDLTTARTWDEIVAKVGEAARAARPGAWIVGHGWHQAKWERPPVPMVEGNPVHASLSAASPNNPVILEHASGHAVFVNARGLQLAGIGRATPNPLKFRSPRRPRRARSRRRRDSGNFCRSARAAARPN